MCKVRNKKILQGGFYSEQLNQSTAEMIDTMLAFLPTSCWSLLKLFIYILIICNRNVKSLNFFLSFSSFTAGMKVFMYSIQTKPQQLINLNYGFTYISMFVYISKLDFLDSCKNLLKCKNRKMCHHQLICMHYK